MIFLYTKQIYFYRTLLHKVAEILPGELKNVAPEETYNVGKHPESAALTVSGGTVTVSVTLTSPLMRETPKSTVAAGNFIVSRFYCGQEKDNYDRTKRGFTELCTSFLVSCRFLLIDFAIHTFSLFFSWPGRFSVSFFKHQDDSTGQPRMILDGCRCTYALTKLISFFRYIAACLISVSTTESSLWSACLTVRAYHETTYV